MDEDWDTEMTDNCTKPVPLTPITSSTIIPDRPAYGFTRGRGSMIRSVKRDEPERNIREINNNIDNNQYDNNINNNNNNFSKPFSSITEFLNIETKSISSIIGKAGATINSIKEKCNVKIIIPAREEIQNQSKTDIKIIGQSKESIDKAIQMIKDKQAESSSFTNYNRSDNNIRNRSSSSKRYHPYENSNNSNNNSNAEDETRSKPKQETTPFAPTPSGGINWDLIRAQPLQNLSKFKDHPAVVKDFYEEDPEITAMTREEVVEYRKKNFNIIVELFKKDSFNYGLTTVKKEEDTRTPEEIEDYLFQIIPKPVKTIEQAFKRFPEILEQCRIQKFVNPSPVQSQLWPILLKGLDCVGIAQTGTGKTLAFLLPALIHIDNQTTPRDKRVGPNCLVLSPTRELAIQIEHEVKKINYKGIKSVCVYGGGDRKEQADSCTKGVEIIIATPGRLYDLIQAGIVNVTSVTYLVLDEADRMLDLGFEPQIMKILLDIRPDRQTVMTSATWPEGVRRLATKYLSEPIQLYVGSLDLRAAKTVTQRLEMVQSEDEKKTILMNYVEKMSPEDKLIVFVGRKATADNLSCDLILKNVQCQSIHGDREQCDREDALEDFKESRVRILIATDVASRGIDVIDITCVLNYDFPRNIEDYVHRVGRTGRAGRLGQAITLMAREDWKHAKELIKILEQGEQEIPNSLVEMASRYEAMLVKRQEEGGGRGGGRFNRGGNSGGSGSGCFKCGEQGHMSRECPKNGGSGGGGGFRGGRGGGFGGSGRDNHEKKFDGVFIPRGRRGGRGGRGRDDDDMDGFVF